VACAACAAGHCRNGVCCGSNGEPCCQGHTVCPNSTNQTCTGATATNPGTCN
jgi:hypothetical protein